MGYWDIVKKIVRDADIVMEIVDARFPQQSRNTELEDFVRGSGKKLIIVLNKSDLISKRNAQKAKDSITERCVFVSARQRSGVKALKIGIEKLVSGDEAKVAIVGYPNTGKSSIINMLRGRKAARTSSTAGFTRGKQHVRISNKILLIDTPGVIPLQESNETLMAMLSAKNAHQLNDMEGAGMEIAEYLILNMPETLRGFYGVEAKDGEEFLEKLAFHRKKLLSGGRPDLNSAARTLIEDFQRGKINENTQGKKGAKIVKKRLNEPT